MRVGINVRLLLSQNMEGIPRFIYETTLQMATAHPEDEFILFFDRSIKDNFGFPSNVKSVVVPWHARSPLLWLWWFDIMLPLYFWWYKIDVFYSGDGYMSLRTKIPTVMVMHDLAYLHYPAHVSGSSLEFYRKYVPKYLNKADFIIAVSEYVKNDIALQLKIPLGKILVAYNAVSDSMDISEVLLPSSLQSKIDNKPYFIYVGALHPRKNIKNLIEGFIQFNAKNHNQYKLVLAGRLAWKTNEITKAIQSSSSIVHAGMVSEKIKYKLISDALALTYVSVFEGFGIPLLEAMKMGTPVITSSVTSMPEVAGEAALLVNPDSQEDIAMSLQKIVDNPALRIDLKRKGLSRYKDFSWEKSADTIYQALKSVVDKY